MTSRGSRAAVAAAALTLTAAAVPGVQHAAPARAAAGATAADLCDGHAAARRNGPLIVRRNLELVRSGVRTYTVSPSGRHRRLLIRPGRHLRDVSLYPSPDGRSATLVRVGRVGPAAELDLVNLRTGRLRVLRTGALGDGVGQWAPATFSPNGRWIAFTENLGQVGLIHPDGTGAHFIPVRGSLPPAPPQPTISHVAYSPTGRCLLGIGGAGPAPADSTPLAAITPDGARDAEVVVGAAIWGGMDLAVTRDGRRAVFTGTTPDGRHAVYLADLADGHVRPIAYCGDLSRAALSPDGRSVAFSRDDGTYVKRLSGGPARRLLKRLYVTAWAPART